MEAVKAMKEGKKSNCDLMKGKMYLYFKDGKLFWEDGRELTHIDIIGLSDNSIRKWEIYKEEDNWNLADDVYPDGLARVKDIKTFIQKVKDDAESLRKKNDCRLTVSEFDEILDKRAGRL